MKSALAVLTACCLLGACVERRAALDCAAERDRVVLAQMLFGRAIGTNGLVGDEEWLDFVDSIVTPAFPDGLTVQDVQGQWRDPATGMIVREPSKLVLILTADVDEAEARMQTIIRAYKARFRQEAVAVFVTPACGGLR